MALTKVKKKDREWKEGIFAKVHALCDEYPAIYAFRYFNMRNERLKDLRQELQETSRFLLASTKKVQAALGRTPEDEYKDNLHQLAEQVHGFAGLFCTKLPHQEVRPPPAAGPLSARRGCVRLCHRLPSRLSRRL